jgi:hypothetical protein
VLALILFGGPPHAPLWLGLLVGVILAIAHVVTARVTCTDGTPELRRGLDTPVGHPLS